MILTKKNSNFLAAIIKRKQKIEPRETDEKNTFIIFDSFKI